METNDDRASRSSRIAISVVVASLLVALGVIFAITQVPDDAPPAATGESGFDGTAAKVGYEWWRAVSSGTISGSLTHPDSTISELYDIPHIGSVDTISVDLVPFGSLSEPQLCYLLTSSDGEQHTGSMVFRAEGERWLVFEVRPDVDSCYVPEPPGS
ncbi:MAG: hypothetical protein WDZ96_03605 [Acidimicrobiia bacterium]